MMKSSLLVSSCVVLGLTSGGAFAEPKCVEIPVEISNPGFEEGKAGWNFAPNMSVVADRPHGGTSCALIDQTEVRSDYVYLTRLVPVEAGAEYGAECFIRTENVKADDRIRRGRAAQR